MKRIVTIAFCLACIAFTSAQADTISFSTFVSQTDIGSVMGSTQVIDFTYAGNKFVGTLYPGDGRLYSTSLSGGNTVAYFGTVPGAGGETVAAASLGQGGFAKGEIYAGSQGSGAIYRFANSGGAPNLFVTLPAQAGAIRGILFDPGTTFGGNMLVTTTGGYIYQVTSAGIATQLFYDGSDVEGMDIVGSSFGQYAGQLLVASETSSEVFLVSNTGVNTHVAYVGGAETVAYVPLNLGSGDPNLEGFYGANFPVDIVKAGPSQFSQAFSQLGGRNLIGDAMITDEFGHGIYDIHWNGSGFDAPIGIGFYPNQPEDGIFVTAQRIQEISTPEPASMVLLGTGLAFLAGVGRRRRNRQ